MKRIKSINILLIVAVLISVISYPGIVSAATTATASLSGPSTASVGDTVDVTLVISESGSASGEGVGGAQGILTYDTNLLELTGTTTLNLNMGYNDGRIIGMVQPPSPYLTGTKDVITFTFKTKAEGSATVSLKLDIADSPGNKIFSQTISKTITIGEKQPEVTKSNDANLKSLAAEGYSISPNFSAGTTSYSVKVPWDATQVKLTGSANHAKATVAGLGTITLTGDTTTVNIVVTAEDTTTKTYTVKIEKEAKPTTPGEETKKDGDATLKSLDVSGFTLSPKFKSNVNTYSMKVANNITSLKVSAIANSDKAKVEISGNTNWKEGNNVVTIKVTAEDGTTNTYIVNVNRAASGDTTTTPTKSSDNYLKSLTINSSHTMSSKFDKNTSTYNIEVPYEVDKLDLSALTNNSKAKVEITGNENFLVGQVNIVEIKVTAEDGSIRIYTLNVTRNSVSSGTDLEDIIIGGGVTLSPKFDSAIGEYTTTVGGDVDKLDISAVAKDKDAKVEIIGNENLKEGKNTVLIKVTDKNGYSKYYTIEVEKEADSSSGGILGSASSYFWPLVGIISGLLLLALILFLLLRKKKEAKIIKEEREYRTPIIEVKPEFNFGSKNTSDDDVVHGNMNQDSELGNASNKPEYKDYEDYEESVPYDIYDETVTKTELIDAIKEATQTKDSSKLKLLLEQDELNQKKKAMKKMEKEKNDWR